jgi:hypothetical protein
MLLTAVVRRPAIHVSGETAMATLSARVAADVGKVHDGSIQVLPSLILSMAGSV